MLIPTLNDVIEVGDGQLHTDEARYQNYLERTQRELKEKISYVLFDLEFNPLARAHDGVEYRYKGEHCIDTNIDMAIEAISDNDQLKQELFKAIFKASHVKEVREFLNGLAMARI